MIPPNRTVVLTGGTGGLGREAARRLAASRVVVLTGRDGARTAAAADDLSCHTGGRVLPAPLDLASLASVRRFAAGLPARGLPPLDAIVCIAGLQTVRGVTRTEDGFETTFAVNHLAHFLLVNLLLPDMTEPGHVVFVSSGTHDPARLTGMPAPCLDDAASLAAPRDDGSAVEGRRRYTTSKLCNVLTAYELARRMRDAGRDVRVKAFDPGLMPGTGLARDYSPVQRMAWRYVLPAMTPLRFPGVRTPRRSGAALAALVTDPRFAEAGGYFTGTRRTRSSEESYDQGKAARLWEGSAALVGL